MSKVSAHFVEFMSPGTFVSETSLLPISKWDVATAISMSKEIKERHGAVPYGFRFITRGRSARDLDSKVVKSSGIYYLGGLIETVAEVERRATKDDAILLSNMKNNRIEKIVTNNNSWKFTAELREGDTVLDMTQYG